MAGIVDENYTSLRSLGNLHFVEGKFVEAEELYTKILAEFDNDRAVIFTNRSAARLSLGKVNEALDDAQKAIESDRHWIKAYYRKASALEQLKRPKDVFETWMAAADECDVESSPWLAKQLTNAKKNWAKVFRDVPISDEGDFIRRYNILTDSREKLSTMAHFWNDSTLAERLRHFNFLVSLIGGDSEPSLQNKEINESNMPSMPLHNYEDLPRSAIGLWCEFFLSLSSEAKTSVMEMMWTSLSSDEQTAVITDLRQFISISINTEYESDEEQRNNITPTM